MLKTRETYVAYRKAGYSRKFREEHEQEILLHQAAKNAFDEMGVKKLPKVKDLHWSMPNCWRKRRNLRRVPQVLVRKCGNFDGKGQCGSAAENG